MTSLQSPADDRNSIVLHPKTKFVLFLGEKITLLHYNLHFGIMLEDEICDYLFDDVEHLPLGDKKFLDNIVKAAPYQDLIEAIFRQPICESPAEITKQMLADKNLDRYLAEVSNSLESFLGMPPAILEDAYKILQVLKQIPDKDRQPVLEFLTMVEPFRHPIQFFLLFNSTRLPKLLAFAR